MWLAGSVVEFLQSCFFFSWSTACKSITPVLLLRYRLIKYLFLFSIDFYISNESRFSAITVGLLWSTRISEWEIFWIILLGWLFLTPFLLFFLVLVSITSVSLLPVFTVVYFTINFFHLVKPILITASSFIFIMISFIIYIWSDTKSLI